MTELTWHLDMAKESLDKWYKSREDYIELANKYSTMWFFGKLERECRRQALKCKTLGLVFHDRFKLMLENKS